MITKAIKILKAGGVVVYPTDTAFAIGCKFSSRKAINLILKIKKRQDRKFTLIASSLYQVEKYFKLNSCQKKLAKKYWPGPVSIVVSNKFAIRVPNNKIARKLAKHAKEPLIATSFNVSGKKTIYNLKNIAGNSLESSLKKHNVFILRARPLTKRKTSAILSCSQNKVNIIRNNKILRE